MRTGPALSPLFSQTPQPLLCGFHTSAFPFLAPSESFSGSAPVSLFSSRSVHTAQSCRCCVMMSLIFSPTELTTTTTEGDCVGSMIVLLLIIRSQIKLNNDFSNLILFSRVPWFIVYECVSAAFIIYFPSDSCCNTKQNVCLLSTMINNSERMVKVRFPARLDVRFPARLDVRFPARLDVSDAAS